MLSASKTRGALEAKRNSWLLARERAVRQLGQIDSALAGLAHLSSAEVGERLAGVAWPGALPTAEHDRAPGQVIHFPERFASHEQARAWALRVMRDQPTFAADGSQIAPLAEFALPIAAAQVGWFANYHRLSGEHEKDLAIEVFVGDELGVGDRDGGTSHVQTRRYQMEVEATIAFMERWGDACPKPLCLVDGPLVVSFVGPSVPRGEQYVGPMSRLLETAERLQIPLVGYVASSSAYDALSMLHALGLLRDLPRLSDAATMHRLLENWGDRSVLYICARDDDVLRTYKRADGSSLADQIAFTYLKTSGTSPPARLELPRWLAEDPVECERVLGLVRADCAVGLGYPYTIETADQTAVLGARDREQFKLLVSEFAARLGTDLRPTPKARSKSRRR